MTHIHLIAPSSAFPEQDIHLTKSYFETLGMQVTIPDDLLGPDILCANKDEIRLAHLKEAFNDPSVDIIWSLLGGYGLTRLIHSIMSMEKPQHKKLFIGFSDGTVLHTFLNQVWNWPTLHGPCARQVAKQTIGAQTREAVLHIIQQGFSDYKPPALQPFNKQAREMSSLSGMLVGGNLCMLHCGLGTPWQIDSSNKILFLEDVDERGYRIDRMLMHFQQVNALKDIKAIVFGDFVKGDEPNGTSFVLPVLQRFAEDIHLPVFSLPGCGHGAENFPLLFNVPLTFSVESLECSRA